MARSGWRGQAGWQGVGGGREELDGFEDILHDAVRKFC